MTELKVKCQCCGHFQRVNDIEALKKQIRTDVIEECIKTITDYCGGLPNNNLINKLEQLKEQSNENY